MLTTCDKGARQAYSLTSFLRRQRDRLRAWFASWRRVRWEEEVRGDITGMLMGLGNRFEPSITAIAPNCNVRTMQLCFAAFQAGGDGFYRNWWEFQADVKEGHIVPCVVHWGDDFAHFGVELMELDDRAPCLNFLYWLGPLDPDILPVIAQWLYHALQRHKKHMGFPSHQEGFVRVVGRRGWRRMIRNLGLHMDGLGFISDKQKAVQHGLFGRFLQ